MLDVGFSEILLTSAIALIVLGPERLPKVARQVGHWMGRARAMARQLSEQLEREVSAEELLKLHNRPSPGGGAPYTSRSAAPNVTSSSIAAPSAPPALPSGAAEPGAVATGSATAGTGGTSESLVPAAAEPAAPIEQVYGLDASATTPAAMHASDKSPP